jgi:hypothetical protein
LPPQRGQRLVAGDERIMSLPEFFFSVTIFSVPFFMIYFDQRIIVFFGKFIGQFQLSSLIHWQLCRGNRSSRTPLFCKFSAFRQPVFVHHNEYPLHFLGSLHSQQLGNTAGLPNIT